MKHLHKLVLVGLTGIIFPLISAIVDPQTTSIFPSVYAAESAPMVDTWILSDEGRQYYIKGGTLRFDRATRAVRESGAYSFTAQIICVYPNGYYTVNHYRMASKGITAVSIDGGPMMGVSDGSIYDRIYHEVRVRYLM